MRCLVLGGAGFFGANLCRGLLAEGHDVRAFDRPNLKPTRPITGTAINWVEGDFVNREDVAHAVEGMDIVFHLISTTLPKTSNDNPVYDVETNIIGTLQLLEAACKAGVKKIVFASSGGTVYGIPRSVPIKESHPTEPITAYGIGKLAIEKYLHLYHVLRGLSYCVLRPANAYGEGQRVMAAQGAVAVFLHKAINRQEIEIWGDGSVVRDYIYIGDIVDAMLKAKDYAEPEGVFNIGTGQGLSLNQLLSEIEYLLGRPVARKYISARSFDVPSNVLDISAAEARLRWKPKVSFRDGLRRTYETLTSGNLTLSKPVGSSAD